jgi:hypothetical protein
MRRVITAIGLFILSGFCIFIYWFGMHGRLMFRPHMTEDWIIWGTATVSFLTGIYFTIKKKQRK